MRVEFDCVVFTYPGHDRPPLHDISFTVEPGEITGLVGADAAPGTTPRAPAARTLPAPGWLHPAQWPQLLRSGRAIRACERRLSNTREIPPHATPRHPRTAHGSTAAEERLAWAIEQAELLHVVARLPEGDGTVLCADIRGVGDRKRRLVEDGSHEELLAGGTYAAMFRAQSR
ncbi:MAG: ABC transporter ATP-binding protein [Firmicutes bacterium]|nr:ABC transporter ATP-binding protein [Bacillota bacterium]